MGNFQNSNWKLVRPSHDATAFQSDMRFVLEGEFLAVGSLQNAEASKSMFSVWECLKIQGQTERSRLLDDAAIPANIVSGFVMLEPDEMGR
ncbi:hypothetical protein BSKO_12903 [Bryopsis sp. KO-2023]|nr:hypothetical protein BSKO_12903 [Bryopsis sp. KO-2023]